MTNYGRKYGKALSAEQYNKDVAKQLRHALRKDAKQQAKAQAQKEK